MVLKRIFGRTDAAPSRVYSAPEGQRIYAIGDIHGRSDLLDELLEKIAGDDRARGSASSKRLIFLGDYVDRGPDSKGAVARVKAMKESDDHVTCLKGNHEEMLIRTCRGDRRTAGVFARNGGRETALSYGIDEAAYDAADLGELTELMAAHVPEDHIRFLAGLVDWVEAGDYLFVHAGIRPGIPIEEQDTSDLRWIRSEFTEYRGNLGAMVIHGHTITEHPDEQVNRIGIDTGAYATGCLTAIGLEGPDRWFVSTGGGETA